MSDYHQVWHSDDYEASKDVNLFGCYACHLTPKLLTSVEPF
jgi:hypothetical protein